MCNSISTLACVSAASPAQLAILCSPGGSKYSLSSALLQDTLAEVQRPFLGGKLQVSQAVPGGQWFLVPTPAFKVNSGSKPCLLPCNTIRMEHFLVPTPAIHKDVDIGAHTSVFTLQQLHNFYLQAMCSFTCSVNAC